MAENDVFDRAIVARIPVLIKAQIPDSSGRRIVEVGASTEEKDLDGDVVLQQALLNSADTFIAFGHLDIDHKSEFGARLGIPDPASYIVGRPLEVIDSGNGNTAVKGEIARSRDGSFDPKNHRYDELWASLLQDPPVVWYASIYGYPTDYEQCDKNPGFCASAGATRLVIKNLDWRSLAFTRTPKNTALSEPARIISAKAYIMELAKSMEAAPTVPLPNSMSDVWMHKACMKCNVHMDPSLLGYKQHFMKCCGYPTGHADIHAHAMMYRRKMDAYLSPAM